MRKIILTSLAAIALLCSCSKTEPSLSKVDRADFQATIEGKQVDLYTLKNKNGMELTVTNFGARIVELFVPDRSGDFVDVVLGHDNLDAYVNYGASERFLGSVIGRYGNRIAKGKFSIDGNDYQVPVNNGENSLHGGNKGFDMVVWDAKKVNPQTIEFHYLSADGEEGYPGNLDVYMTYKLNNANELVITYKATTDKKTVVNLTHHSFFNLRGAGNGTINDHILNINADYYIPIDEGLIPLGEIVSVSGTPFDFRLPTAIGARVDDDNEQLKNGSGYDHNWVIDRKTAKDIEIAATLYEPVSGRFMEVWTTEPGIQFYGGNFFSGMKGKDGKSYGYREALAFETQHYPDSPNQPDFPSTLLSPGETYEQVSVYRFFVR